MNLNEYNRYIIIGMAISVGLLLLMIHNNSNKIERLESRIDTLFALVKSAYLRKNIE